jgi:hypothetical protein
MKFNSSKGLWKKLKFILPAVIPVVISPAVSMSYITIVVFSPGIVKDACLGKCSESVIIYSTGFSYTHGMYKYAFTMAFSMYIKITWKRPKFKMIFHIFVPVSTK